jgi:endonuclease/exonuclease/phosphatase family metal-dependent hydrolase
MRKPIVAMAALLSLAVASAVNSQGSAHASTTSETSCTARQTSIEGVPVQWFAAPAEDAREIASWCRGVGAPLIALPPATSTRATPSLEDLVVLSWNAHLADGQLTRLIGDLRNGALTEGRPVEHFVLLVQELYRRGREVPEFAPHARSAFAIVARDPRAPDARDYAERLGLALAYVPSMRNGAELLEDRGNAILSTERLEDLFAVELPFERQRRVAAGAVIRVDTGAGVERLHLVDTHLEPLAAPSALWVLRNPRRRQVGALLELLQQPRFVHDSVGTIVGGDFNTVQGGAREEAYRRVRAWSHSLGHEDMRATHLMGRLDYVFARLSPEWQVSTSRVNERYGSDHHPVLARFHRRTPTP